MYVLGILDAVTRGAFASETETSRYRHRVWPQYIDFNVHMNQAAYLRVMELGRWQWFAQRQLLRRMFRERLQTVVVKVEIEYRRELKPMQRFDVLTRCVRRRGRVAEVHQLCVVGDQIHTLLRTDVLVLHGGKVVPESVAASVWDPIVEPEFAMKAYKLVPEPELLAGVPVASAE